MPVAVSVLEDVSVLVEASVLVEVPADESLEVPDASDEVDADAPLPCVTSEEPILRTEAVDGTRTFM